CLERGLSGLCQNERKRRSLRLVEARLTLPKITPHKLVGKSELSLDLGRRSDIFSRAPYGRVGTLMSGKGSVYEQQWRTGAGFHRGVAFATLGSGKLRAR